MDRVRQAELAARLAAERAERQAEQWRAVRRGVGAAGVAVGSAATWAVGRFAGWVGSARTDLDSDGPAAKHTTLALVKLIAVVLIAFVFVVGLVGVLRRLA